MSFACLPNHMGFKCPAKLGSSNPFHLNSLWWKVTQLGLMLIPQESSPKIFCRALFILSDVKSPRQPSQYQLVRSITQVRSVWAAQLEPRTERLNKTFNLIIAIAKIYSRPGRQQIMQERKCLWGKKEKNLKDLVIYSQIRKFWIKSSTHLLWKNAKGQSSSLGNHHSFSCAQCTLSFLSSFLVYKLALPALETLFNSKTVLPAWERRFNSWLAGRLPSPTHASR